VGISLACGNDQRDQFVPLLQDIRARTTIIVVHELLSSELFFALLYKQIGQFPLIGALLTFELDMLHNEK
jgi:hypothetical protein